MADEGARPRLGRGLAALIADTSAGMPGTAEARDRRRVRMGDIAPNPRNPRRHFAEAELEDLSNSIREKGVLQPILVRPQPGGGRGFEIIAGERRWRAAAAAGLADVPVVVVEVDDREALELAIIENVQRADLNAIEEARGYERLSREFHHSPTDLARIIGKSRSHVANMLRLLKLPASVEAMVVEGALTAGHARALLGFDDPEPVARRVIERGLNVRDVERLAQGRQRETAVPAPATSPAPASGTGRGRKAADARTTDTKRATDTKALAHRLAAALGLAVEIEARGAGGEIRIRYATRDELDSLCRQLNP